MVKTNMKELTSTSATFGDGTEETVEVVIFDTGYTSSFPFLDDNSEILDSEYTMFKSVFPPQLEKPTLPFVACSSLWEPPLPHQSSKAEGLHVCSQV